MTCPDVGSEGATAKQSIERKLQDLKATHATYVAQAKADMMRTP